MARLKMATATEHHSIEESVNRLLQTQDIWSYCWLLERFWGFFQPMENDLSAVSGLERVLPDLASRMRTQKLENDLCALGMQRDAILHLARCTKLPNVRTPAEALGCLYVMEGSTLGGQIIVRQLGEREPSLPSTFFQSYGSGVGPMWKKFCVAAETYAADNPGEAETICASARQTFLCLEIFLRGTHA